MVGVTPSQIAMMFLKINIALFIVTVGANTLAIFPYIMHVHQIANYIAMDIANKNYIVEEDLEKFVSHFDMRGYDEDANVYTKFTFRDLDFTNVQQETEVNNAGNYAKGGKATAFTYELPVTLMDYKLPDTGSTTVAVSAEVLSGTNNGKNLIIGYNGAADFDPLGDLTHLKDGLDGNNLNTFNSILVNRGTPFKVTVKTRFKLTGYAFGYQLHSAIPIIAQSIGVTTQYYQYDN